MVFGRDKSRAWLELILLSVLAEEALYGYAIIKRVNARSEGRIRLTPGVLYPLLHGLEDQKLIRSDWEEVRSDRREDEAGEGRKRKWYRLTPKGRRRLEQQIRAHRDQQAIIDSFLPTETESGGAA